METNKTIDVKTQSRKEDITMDSTEKTSKILHTQHSRFRWGFDPLNPVHFGPGFIRVYLCLSAVAFALAFLTILAPAAAAAERPEIAIITRDQTPLRAAPRAAAPQQAVLWQGEMVEIRGERLDYLQVYDPGRERAGFVHVNRARRIRLTAEEAPGLLAVVRFLRDTPGAEALGIGLAVAYVHAAPADTFPGAGGIEALDALGSLADRLARRASSGAARSRAAETALAAHLDVASRYGIRFTSHERDGRMQICYDGDAFHQVLAMPSSPVQRAHAALALTRQECVAPDLLPLERVRVDEWRAEVLDEVEAAALPRYLRNRVLMRRAGVWSGLAFQRARKGEAAEAAARRALAELAGIDKAELTDADVRSYNDAAIRVSASRWAAMPAPAGGKGKRPYIDTEPGQPGETCILLLDERHDAANPLAKRCTYGIVWASSATLNREGSALALAVQPLDAWREVWVFRKQARGWTVRVLPPDAAVPGLGYAEFAGWVPGGRQMLVAREARGEGKYRRSFEVVRLDTLAVARRAGDPGILDAFRRWQDPAWKLQTVSLR